MPKHNRGEVWLVEKKWPSFLLLEAFVVAQFIAPLLFNALNGTMNCATTNESLCLHESVADMQAALT